MRTAFHGVVAECRTVYGPNVVICLLHKPDGTFGQSWWNHIGVGGFAITRSSGQDAEIVVNDAGMHDGHIAGKREAKNKHDDPGASQIVERSRPSRGRTPIFTSGRKSRR